MYIPRASIEVKSVMGRVHSHEMPDPAQTFELHIFPGLFISPYIGGLPRRGVRDWETPLDEGSNCACT